MCDIEALLLMKSMSDDTSTKHWSGTAERGSILQTSLHQQGRRIMN